MNNDAAIRLLILDKSLNDSEHTSSAIRTLGYVVKTTRVDDLKELAEKLEKNQYDICLFCLDSLFPIPIENLLNTLTKLKQNLSIIALPNAKSRYDTAKLMKAGVVDVVNKGSYDHLKWVVNREFQRVRLLGELEMLKITYADSEKRGQMLMNSSRDAIAYIHEGMHVHANEAYLELFGFGSVEDIQGAPIMDLVTTDDQETLKGLLRNQSDNREAGEDTLDTHLVHTNGSSFSATMKLSRTIVDNEACIQIIIYDRSDAKELEQKITLLSQTDQLTGLYNRQHLVKLLQERCDQAVTGNTSYSLLQIRLENFEMMRSTLGVVGSDKVMVAVAHVLRKTVQKTDILCRFQDATYTVLSNLSTKKQITAYANKILKIIDKFICQVGNNSINPHCSIGIALIDESTPVANEALSRAERALKMALSESQSLRIYVPAPGEKTQKQIDQLWTKRLSKALKDNRFLLQYQPIVSLGGDEYERYEISYCAVDDDTNPILYTEFAAAASRTGMIRNIDRWMIMNAARQLVEKVKQAPSITFFIPLSESTLEDPDLFRWVRQLLESLSLPHDCIVFQMSESFVTTHLNQARAVSAALHNIHCKISLDNFGVEPNPFQLIKHVPANYVKINREFVKNLTTSQENQQAIQTIAEKARNHGQISIAPGVEDAGSLSVLWGLGVDMVQGDFLQAQTEQLNYDFSTMVS